jgi:hypothetical protein
VEADLKPDIPESALEHVITFSSHWVDRWTIPNPFVSLFYDGLQAWDVTLAEFAFRQDAKNVLETALIVSIPKLRSTIVVGVNALTFRTANPDWDMAPDLVKLFDTSLELFQGVISFPIKSQACTIAFHVTPGTNDISGKTASLVRTDVVGEAEFYGISKYSAQMSLFLERSLKYAGGAFFRLTRRFDSTVKFADVALALYADEAAALAMIGIKDLM